MTYGPPSQIWNLGTVNDLWSPIPYMEWGNLIMGPPICTIQEPCNCQRLIVPHTLYGMQEPCNGVSHMYNIIWMLESCNCQWQWWSPIPYMECYSPSIPDMECRNFVMVSPHMYNIIWMLVPCNCQWLLWSPIPSMECGNLVTVNDLWPPYLLWNVGTVNGVPHMYNVGTL